MRSTIYIETSVISYLTARTSNDIRVAAWQAMTADWWDNRRFDFDVYISEFVVAEASRGNPDAAARRIAAIADISELEATEEVKSVAHALLSHGSLPQKAELDAYHVAIATVNGMDYLLTWNCTHIANTVMRPKIEAACRLLGYEPPIICTPLELLRNKRHVE